MQCLSNLIKSLSFCTPPRLDREQADDPIDMLLQREIKTFDELENVWHDSVFIAFDCEFLLFQETDTPTASEIGLACIHQITTAETSKTPSNHVDLKQLFTDLRMKATSIKLSPRYEHRMKQIDDTPSERRWAREEFRFGTERYARVEDVEETLCQTIHAYSTIDLHTTNIVLVGYHMVHDLDAMRKDFPAVANLFTTCIDLRTIFRSMYPGDHVNELGIRKTLELYGYGAGDYGSRSCYHNPGNDAVKTLALLYGLKDAENIQSLISEQGRVKTEQTEIVERRKPPCHHQYVVIIEPVDPLASLPSTLRSANKLAELFKPYGPRRVGSYKKPLRVAGKPVSRYFGWALFKTEEACTKCAADHNNTMTEGTLLYVGKPRAGGDFRKELAENQEKVLGLEGKVNTMENDLLLRDLFEEDETIGR
ncbi:hypothetical protein F5Y19DRAFT_343232 [Xylariaceae sp. FL1651]|nr:hypothetical protein F5Y19DRAFT_343232 [Xylariaceae sp. FL1651]